jgi:hypothetical protein
VIKLTGKVARPDFVPMSSELNRISKIPRRAMSPEDLEWLADEMTARLKKPRGLMRLKPVQAWALFELGTVGGLFAPITVGGGKTLVSLLSPVVMKAQRPLLIVPAGLVEKTKRDKEVLEQHWYLPLFLRIMSFEWLGREQAATALEEWDPDLVFIDECHRAKNNKDAAVARRLTRFFRDRDKKKRSVVVGQWQGSETRSNTTQCAAASGTVTKRSIRDYAHILTWCLPAQLLPIPTHWNDLDLWSEALDEKKSEGPRIDPGALEILCADDADKELWKTDRVLAARRTYRRRLVETPGVVATYETQVDASLVIRARGVEPGPAIDEAFENLRSEWVTPDDWSIPDALTFARHARELALGFFYRWEPRPPIEWQLARTAWHQHVRQVLNRSRTHDSEKQVRRAVLASALKMLDEQWHTWAKEIATPPKDRTKRVLDAAQRLACSVALIAQFRGKSAELEDVKKLFAWKGVEDTFEINTVPVWIDSAACEFAAKWARENAGIIWVEHRCVGERLRNEFGLAYYGRKGLDLTGKFIDDHDRRKSLVASRPANSEGRNLQGWSKNLVMSLLPNGARNEQCLGRTHRPGQLADEVEFDFVVSCEEHLLALDQALRDAKYIESSTGAPQKLLLATLDVDRGSLRGVGPRWSNE